MKSMAAMVNRGFYGADIAETISIYNKEPISFEKTLIDMTNFLKQISKNKQIINLRFTFSNICEFVSWPQ